MDEAFKEIAETIAAARQDEGLTSAIAYGELTVTVKPAAIVPFLRFLHDDARLAFISLIDVCGVDWPQRALRFDVVYHLLSPRKNKRIRVKVMTDEDTPVAS